MSTNTRALLNKVPQITIYFWIIKVLCTTVGETFADYLSDTLGWGLTNTAYVMGAALAIVLIFQFRLPRYVPFVYWLAVVLISIFGTLITDNMVENMGVSLQASTVGFSIALALTFAVWWGFERTLSIHTIVTFRREAFYWLAVLFTFALGTAAGDLISDAQRLQALARTGDDRGHLARLQVGVDAAAELLADRPPDLPEHAAVDLAAHRGDQLPERRHVDLGVGLEVLL